MKYFKTAFFIFHFSFFIALQAQGYGDRIPLGVTFSDTDSTILDSTHYTTEGAADKVYSKACYLGRVEGSYCVTFYADGSSGTPTFNVYARFYHKAAPSAKHWEETWNTVFSSAAVDSLYKLEYDGTDPTWWGKAGMIQYYVVQSGAGGAEHYLGHYPK